MAQVPHTRYILLHCLALYIAILAQAASARTQALMTTTGQKPGADVADELPL